MNTFLWFLAAAIGVFALFHLFASLRVAMSLNCKLSSAYITVRIVVGVAFAFLAYWVAPL